MPSASIVISVVLVGAVLFGAHEGRAESCRNEICGGLSVIMLGGSLGSLVTGAGNAWEIADGDGSSPAWAITGIVSGAMALTAAALLGYNGYDEVAGISGASYAFMGLGAATIGTAVVGLSLRPEPQTRVTLVPLIQGDSDNTVVGLMLSGGL